MQKFIEIIKKKEEDKEREMKDLEMARQIDK